MQTVEFDTIGLRFVSLFKPLLQRRETGEAVLREKYGFCASLAEGENERLSNVSHLVRRDDTMGVYVVLSSHKPCAIFGGFTTEQIAEAQARHIDLDSALLGQPASVVGHIWELARSGTPKRVMFSPMAVCIHNNLELPTFEVFQRKAE